MCRSGSARVVAACIVCFAAAFAGARPGERVSSGASSTREGPVLSTYSIVARDPASGAFGVAVQSHWFQVGPIVPWAEAGVGAVATQSLAEVSYGPRGLALMRNGIAAKPALEVLLASDEQRDVRQVAMVDARGNVATWTGPRCIAQAGHRAGEGYSVQANLMAHDGVPGAMAEAYESASEEAFAERMLLALEAAERAGGDIRGRQSAALIVVRGEKSERPWEDTLVDLRVDDHENPLAELRRLYELHRAYSEMNMGDAALAENDLESAVAHYARACDLAPGIVELPFWQAVALFGAGERERAVKIFREIFAREPRWRTVAERLPRSGLLPDDPESLEVILSAAE